MRIDIPGSWTEGGSKTFQTGRSHDNSDEKNLYSLQIAYSLEQGKLCKAEFESTDSFHWTV
jgi:hypothetical protein